MNLSEEIQVRSELSWRAEHAAAQVLQRSKAKHRPWILRPDACIRRRHDESMARP